MDTAPVISPAEEVVRNHLLLAASAASAAVLDLIEAARGDVADAAPALDTRETAENLADALQTVLAAQLEDDGLAADRRGAISQLAGAVERFLEGWA